MKEKIYFYAMSAFAILIVLAQPVYSCSNFFVKSDVPGHAATVGRSLDFGSSPEFIFARAKPGIQNISNINVPFKDGTNINNVVKWTNDYGFIGLTFHGAMMIEGVNTEGLYVGNFYFPGEAQYQNPSKDKKNLSYGDLIPYLLGTCSNVDKAVEEIKKVQVILTGSPNDPPTKYNGKEYSWTAHPFHWALRDTLGNIAVLEYINGKLNIYQGANINDNNGAGQILTNSPALSEQKKYYQYLNGYKQFQTANTNAIFSGLYMNGSGMLGVPGDWTPPSRFSRGNALIKVMPKPLTPVDANYLAFSGIMSLIIPPGATEGPTLWISLSDLVNKTYRAKILYNIVSRDNSNETKSIVKLKPQTQFKDEWTLYNVLDVVNAEGLPKIMDEINGYFGWEEFKTVRDSNNIPKDQLPGVYNKAINGWDTAKGPAEIHTVFSKE